MNTIKTITDKIIKRSQQTRFEYLSLVDEMRNNPPARDRLSCSNWAHVVAPNSDEEKVSIPAGAGARSNSQRPMAFRPTQI